VGRDIRRPDADADGNSQLVAYTDSKSDPIAYAKPVAVAHAFPNDHADPDTDALAKSDASSDAFAESVHAAVNRNGDVMLGLRTSGREFMRAEPIRFTWRPLLRARWKAK